MHTHLVAAGGVPLPLLDNHGLKVLTLGHLSLDILDYGAEVWNVLSLVSIWRSHIGWCPYILGLGPLLLGQKRVGHGELPLVSRLPFPNIALLV